MKTLTTSLAIGLSLSVMVAAQASANKYTNGITVRIINNTKSPIVKDTRARIDFSYKNHTADKKNSEGSTSVLYLTKSSPNISSRHWTVRHPLNPNENWSYWTLSDTPNNPSMSISFNDYKSIASCTLPTTHFKEGSFHNIVLTLSGNSIGRSVACTAQVIS